MLNDPPRLATDPGLFVTARTGADADAPVSPFAHCEVFDDMARARAPWAEIEGQARASPYQSYRFVETWMETTGRARAIRPMIVVARDTAGRVNAVLPLGRSRRGPVWVAEFIGGADANFKMGLFRPGLQIGSAAIVALLRRAARATRPWVDVFWLINQPLSWQGVANPMAALPHRPSPSFGYKSALTKDFDGWLKRRHSKEAQKKLRKKERRLNELGRLSHVVAQDEASARAILAAFLSQKEARMRAMGYANSYEAPHTARFFDMAATRGPAQAAPILELHALTSGERIVATFGALVHPDRFCGMFISYESDPEISRCSPGQLLILEIVRDLCVRGVATFDLGVGEARYKDENCEAEEPLFDAAVAVTPLGLVSGAAALLQRRIKRWAKHTPWAWKLADGLRKESFRLRGGMRRPPDGDL
jgi:CelD/BcsL family acetyltransferase involved in cellulose biosynthesis